MKKIQERQVREQFWGTGIELECRHHDNTRYAGEASSNAAGTCSFAPTMPRVDGDRFLYILWGPQELEV